VTQLERFIDRKQYIDNTYIHLNDSLKITVEFCKKNTDIIFTTADKGNKTVTLDRKHYLNSVNEMLKDSTTYELVNKNPIKNLEQKLNNILKRWSLAGFISKQECYILRASDSSLPKAYGLP